VGGTPHPSLPPQGGKGIVRLAVLVSGGGSNLEAILEAQESGKLPGVKVVQVISSKAGVVALERAQRHGVPSAALDYKTFATEDLFQTAVLQELEKARPDVVCLAGYLKRIAPEIIRRFRGRILNIHPALLPKYGGPGMYGHFVHEAVIAAGDPESGCTVHVVDEEFDHGPILAQAKVPVLRDDTAETLAARVLVQEHILFPRVIREFCQSLGL
jgi:phosphoribosylglycinamide formyltransferase 1